MFKENKKSVRDRNGGESLKGFDVFVKMFDEANKSGPTAFLLLQDKISSKFPMSLVILSNTYY